jgi:hypothetical protein
MPVRRPADEEDEEFEDDEFEDEIDVADIVSEVVAHPKVSKTLNLLTHTLDRFGQLIDQVSRGRTGFGNGQPNDPPTRPARQDHKKAINPYLVLGFVPGQKLTAEIIKVRKRKLATIYHPDNNGAEGDVEALKMVNAAADMLLKKLT